MEQISWTNLISHWPASPASPTWRRQLRTTDLPPPELLHAVCARAESCTDDVPLLITRRNSDLCISLNRVPPFRGDAPSDQELEEQFESLTERLKQGGIDCAPVPVAPRQADRIRCVLGLLEGCVELQKPASDALRRVIDKVASEFERTPIPDALQPLVGGAHEFERVAVCVLNQRGVYLEKGIELSLARSVRNVEAVLTAAAALKQEEVSIEDLELGEIRKFLPAGNR